MSLVHVLITSRLGNSVILPVYYRNNVVHQISHELVYSMHGLYIYSLIVQGSPIISVQSTMQVLFMPRCACASEVYGCVCACVCVCVCVCVCLSVCLGCYTELLRDQ